MYLTAPAGDPRLFIVEKGGAIRIVKDGALLEAPFLSLADKVSTGDEQGLLGLAFDPAYATNGRFVVHYTDVSGNTVVSMFRVSAGNPDLADPATELLILTAEQPFPNHNGGQILFGADGMLYIGLGDGGGGGDPGGRGQAVTDLLGDILRVDVSSGTGYTVPADNPLVGRTDARPEIWSYGLRNPWRFSFDPATGDLYIADVGQSAWEEVDVVTAAAEPDVAPTSAGTRPKGPTVMPPPRAIPVRSLFRSSSTRIARDARSSAATSTGALPFPPCRGIISTPISAAGGCAAFGCRTVRRWSRSSGRRSPPADCVTSFGQDAAGELYILTAEGMVSRIVPR